MTDPYTAILGELTRSGVRFLVIGAFGVNYYARRKQVFTVEGQEIPVAPLAKIVESKKAAARDKDLLFLTALSKPGTLIP